MKPLGVHYLLELADCNQDKLNNCDLIEALMLKAAKDAGATIVSYKFNTFNPQGISGFVVIAESHLSIHTWPEYKYAAIDIFTCGDPNLVEKCKDNLVHSFEANDYQVYHLNRGVLDGSNLRIHPQVIQHTKDISQTIQ